MVRGNLKRNNHRRDVAAKTQILNATEMHQSENDGSDAIRPADGNSIIQRTHWRLGKKLLFAFNVFGVCLHNVKLSAISLSL